MERKQKSKCVQEELQTSVEKRGITIDGNAKSRVFHITSERTSTIRVAINGLTITNGKTGDYGGGVYVEKYSKVKFNDCVFMNNRTLSDGGGVFVSGSNYSTGELTNCVVKNNIANNGGGVSLDFNPFNTSSKGHLFTNCKICGNQAKSSGGGVYSFGTVTYMNCTIDCNTASSYGGGVYSFGTVTYMNCAIDCNTASSYGGGVHNSSGTVIYTNCSINRNKSNLYGGGVYSSRSNDTYLNCTIASNQAKSGGGVYSTGNDTYTKCAITGNTVSSNSILGACGGGVNNSGTATYTNCAITGNSACSYGSYGSYGGGVYSTGNDTYFNCTIAGNSATADSDTYGCGGGIYKDMRKTTLYNSILALNSASNGGDLCVSSLSDSSAFAYNTLSNFEDWANRSEMDVINYLFDDSLPLFTNINIGDYMLAKNSQAIDRGDDYYMIRMEDLAGNNRIVGQTIDLGAYEYQATTTQQLDAPTLSVSNSTNTSITVKWTAVANASGYTLQYQKADDTTWTTTSSSISASTSKYSIVNLNANMSYNIRIFANGLGDYADSEYSTILNYRTSETPSTIVTTPRDVVDPTDGLISLREALAYAPSGETVTFAAALAGQIITVDSELLIEKSVSIDGCESRVTLSGNGTSRVIRFLGADSDEYTLANLTITGGSNTHGAGVYVATGVANIVNCSIVGNTATTSGGGLYVAGKGAAKVANTVIADNSAKYGGGVYSYGADGKAVVFTNCTITNNTAMSSGSGLHTETANGIVEIYNSIIALNIGKSDVGKKSSGRVVTAYHTLSSFGAWTSGGQNVVYSSSRPLFTDVAQGDYSLAPGSQAINLGDASYVVGAVDLAGNPRIVGASVDLGTFEYQSSVETPSLVVTTLLDVVDASDGLISLREAIAYAGSGDTITFDTALQDSTIIVNSELLIEKPLTIDGGGAITLSGRSGGGTTRVLRFLGGESAEYTIIGLAITRGSHTHGAGVYVATGTANIVNCSIVGNTSTTSGGGLYVAGKGAVNVVNTLIANNSAKYGGGVYSYGGAGNEVVLTNCTIANNKATASGAGLHMETANGTVSIRNSIVALNVGAQEIQRKTNARVAIGVNTLSTFTAWSTGSVDTLQYDGTQPLFVNASQGDFTLTSNSQALNCGNKDFVETEFDLAGAERVVGGKVDLGAYELQITAEQETPSVVVTTVADVVDPTDGLISLREALAYAEPGATVTFDASLAGQTLTLSSELLVEKELSIDGESHGITLSGGGHTRVVRFLGSVEDEYALRNLTITGGVNTHGAGVYVATGAVNIVNCSIVGNNSTTSGGGIYVAGKGEATIVNTLVANNSAKYGGGVYCYGATDKAVLISNSTIANNSATSSGSGLHLETANGTLEIRNSIIALNTGKTDVYKKSTGRSIKAINTLSTYTAWTSGKNNLIFQSALPLFTDVSSSDFTLAASSQALDKGSTASVISAFDLSGSARIVGGKVDLGAYERQADASNAIIDKAIAELFIDEFETL